MVTIHNTTQTIINPPTYLDIYQDYNYYSIILKSIIQDIQLFQLYNRSFKSLYYNFQNRLQRISIAVCSSSSNSKAYNNNIIDSDNNIKYFCDDHSKDFKYIQIGAHFYHRNNNKSFLFKGIIKTISSLQYDTTCSRQFYYFQLDPYLSSLNNLKPGQIVPQIHPGGRGSARYNRDAASDANILRPSNPMCGIIH